MPRITTAQLAEQIDALTLTVGKLIDLQIAQSQPSAEPPKKATTSKKAKVELTDDDYREKAIAGAKAYHAKKGVVYIVFKRPSDGHYIFRSEASVDRLRSKGMNPTEVYGEPVYSTRG